MRLVLSLRRLAIHLSLVVSVLLAPSRACAQEAPTVTITAPAQDAVVRSTSVAIVFTAPTGTDVQHVEVIVDKNSQGLLGADKFRRRSMAIFPDVDPSADSWVVDPIQIPSGTVHLQVVVHTATAAIRSGIVRVIVHEKSPTRERLSVLAIGISAYRDPIKLQYAAKDAESVASQFKTQEPSLYAQVSTKTITDRDATLDHIKKALADLVVASSQSDLTILFLAGHGTLDANGRYFYVPVDFDPTHPLDLEGKALGEDDLLGALRMLSGNAVVFLDTCDAAGLADGRGMNKKPTPSQQVAQAKLESVTSKDHGGGIRLIYSAAATDEALEGKEWGGHGVFTYALLDWLQYGVPKGSVENLYDQVASQVSNLTSATQQPRQGIIGSVGADFPSITRVPSRWPRPPDLRPASHRATIGLGVTSAALLAAGLGTMVTGIWFVTGGRDTAPVTSLGDVTYQYVRDGTPEWAATGVLLGVGAALGITALLLPAKPNEHAHAPGISNLALVPLVAPGVSRMCLSFQF